MPTNYEKISRAIDNLNAIKVHWSKDPANAPDRVMLPYLIGQSDRPGTNGTQQDDVVLVYRYEPGVDPGVERENWRCYKIGDFTTVAEEGFSETWTPPRMTGRQRERQNCVQYRTMAYDHA